MECSFAQALLRNDLDRILELRDIKVIVQMGVARS